MNAGAIILCGGKSTRMGRDKASLPFGNETMLARVVRVLSEVVPVESIVIVAAAEQPIPSLPVDIAVVRDERPERGPLEGLAAGLAAIPRGVEAVYATSCDVPLLRADWIRAMFGHLGNHEIAVPKEGKFHHPLAAVYRPSVLPHVRALLASDRLRPVFLFEMAKTHEIDVESLRAIDPRLDSLKNLNRPEDYQAALQLADLADDR